jgi:2-oxoglutarate ferredoxin oxidoreductase subunit gamma
MRREIIVAGFGGQGISLMGQLIAAAATAEGRNAVWTPSHGPEMRGGESNCTVVVSDQPIGSPVASQLDTAIIMDRPSLQRLEGAVDDGLVMINSSLVPASTRRGAKNLRVRKVPATSLAEEVGDARVANIVMLGGFIAVDPLVSAESVKRALHQMLPERRHGMLALNERALDRGMQYVREGR